MAKAKVIDEKKMEISDAELRVSLRFKDRETRNFLKQMGQVQRAMFIELAVIRYIREANN